MDVIILSEHNRNIYNKSQRESVWVDEVKLQNRFLMYKVSQYGDVHYSIS